MFHVENYSSIKLKKKKEFLNVKKSGKIQKYIPMIDGGVKK